MEQLLTTKQVMEYFNVRDSRTITKFINQGLKVIPIGQKDYRFRPKDVEEFAEHLQELAQEKFLLQIPKIKKHKNKTMNIDFEKMKINRVMNRVI